MPDLFKPSLGADCLWPLLRSHQATDRSNQSRKDGIAQGRLRKRMYKLSMIGICC